MCGIFAYKGRETKVHTVLLHGLERLEYRGYDSAGIFVSNGRDHAHIRSTGKVGVLNKKVKDLNLGMFHVGIAHTRWATHGGVTDENSHPHVSNDGKIALVHNGIIENYAQLKKQLEAKWYTFYSQTDTEVVANMMQEYRTGDMASTIELVTAKMRGAYALVIMHTDMPHCIAWVKLWSPLIFGYNTDNDYYFSSDTQALSGYAEKIIYLEEGDIVVVDGNDYSITSWWAPTSRNAEDFDQEALAVSKWSYKHFMLKEIEEQPAIIKRIYKGRINFDTQKLHADAFHGMQHEHYRDIVFVACGTSSYAGVLASYRLQDLAGIQARVEIASEYENKRIFVDDHILHVFISQSGETADSISCLHSVLEQWGRTFGVVNVVGSTLARLTTTWLFTRAGAEIGVASTKAFTAQVVCLLLTSLYLAKKRWLRVAKYKQIVRELEQLPMYIETILQQGEYIRSIAQQLTAYKNFFFLGRHYQYATACESALKFKEITYLHAEAYPAGELKHGPLALIEEDVPSVVFAPYDLLFEKNLSTIQEIKARNGKVLVISDRKVDAADWHITIPSTCAEIYPILCVVVWQLLSYHTADLLGKDIDKPRNLAKSVTVK